MKRYGIVVIGYNRIESLKRLLQALCNASYNGVNPVLIISLDYAGMPEMVKLAERFEWPYGEKIVKAYEARQGLRKHILNCGEFLEMYDLDAVAVFEDDIVPSPAYFNYVVQAVDFYADCNDVAGISLYTHLWNVNCEKPFQPMLGQYDTFFLQFAQSWGQVWLRKQWNEFKLWYEKNFQPFKEANGVPANVSSWKDSSWLKYHIKYCVEKQKYFVYPYESLCTNFTDVGTHNDCSTTMYQVPMQMDVEKKYLFSKKEISACIYDAYFENEALAEVLGIAEENLCVDLYGTKPISSEKQYWLTMKKADYKVERSYGLLLKPHELNVIMDIPGKDIKLYNLSQPCKNDAQNVSIYKIFDYYFRLTHCAWAKLLKLLCIKIKLRIKRYNG